MEWQPIETAPKDGRRFLVWGPVWARWPWDDADRDEPKNWQDPDYYIALGPIRNGECEVHAGFEDAKCRPTKWMPLPAPPKT